MKQLMQVFGELMETGSTPERLAQVVYAAVTDESDRLQYVAGDEARFERSPDQNADVFAANLIDQRHGVPITVAYGRYGRDGEQRAAELDMDVALDRRLAESRRQISWG